MKANTVTHRLAHRRALRLAPVVAVLLVAAATASADSRLAAANAVAEGKRLLEAGKFDDALDYFKKAEVDLPDSPEIAYDRGIAFYRKAEFDKAKDAFMNALRTRDPQLESKAKFNLGNCAYSTALQKLTDLSGAIDELRKAITYWRDSLDLNPEDAEARQNIETAQLLMKDLLDKEKKKQEEEQKKQQEEQKKNPESQPTSQPDQQDQKQDQQKKDQEKQDQNQQNQQNKDQKNDKKKDQQSNPQQQQKPQQKQDPKDQQSKDKQKEKEKQEQQKLKDKQDMQRQKAQQKKDQMSREDAERKLQAIRDKERARREDKRKREATEAGRMPVDRDW